MPTPSSLELPKNHVFNEQKVCNAIEQWQATGDKKHLKEAALACEDLINLIIRYYKFDHHAPLEDLRQDCYLKLLAVFSKNQYNKKKGSAFNWIYITVKNFLITHITKLTLRQKTVQPSSDWLEKVVEGQTHSTHSSLVADNGTKLFDSVRTQLTRWWGEPESSMVNYYLSAISKGAIESQNNMVNTAMYAYNTNKKTAELVLDTVLAQLRMSLLEQEEMKLSVTEMLKMAHSHTLLPELIDCIGAENTHRLIAVFGGMYLKIPSPRDLERAAKQVKASKVILNPHPAESDPIEYGAALLKTNPRSFSETAETLYHSVTNGTLFKKKLVLDAA